MFCRSIQRKAFPLAMARSASTLPPTMLATMSPSAHPAVDFGMPGIVALGGFTPSGLPDAEVSGTPPTHLARIARSATRAPANAPARCNGYAIGGDYCWTCPVQNSAFSHADSATRVFSVNTRAGSQFPCARRHRPVALHVSC
jgi:hypothetical protein